MAHVADWCFLLVRTDPSAAKHKGISFLLVDMKTPGITVRPLRQITGEAEFNEVFFENVRVPRANLLGAMDDGWQIAVAALQNERGILYVVGMQILLKEQRDRLFDVARALEAGRDAVQRQELARIWVGEQALQLNGYRTSQDPARRRRARARPRNSSGVSSTRSWRTSRPR